MMMIASELKRRLRTSSAFYPLRSTYRYFFKHRLWDAAQERTEFYKQFVSPGSLVFDVGANEGEYARSFLEIGARVVSVEPQPQCIKILKNIANPRFSLETVAVGERFGKTTMKVCSEDGMSSLSDEWVNLVGKRYTNNKWDQTIEVEIVTLDSLIAKHGMPDFIKIDVEGYELQALSGLSTMPKGMSFEVNHEWMHVGQQCLEWKGFAGNVQFNWFFGASPKKVDSPRWVDLDEMKKIIRSDEFTSRLEPCDIIAIRD